VRRTLFHFVAAVSMAAASMVSAVQAAVVSFGSGTNVFQMEFVTIGNPGNAPDPTGALVPAGAVGYTYGIGKFEVSREIIAKFNASQSLQISLTDMTGMGSNGPNRPATGVSWNEAARFVNWLNTSTGRFSAYKFTSGRVNENIELWTASDALDYDPSNPYRSKRTTYVLPSFNEWHKAAYYSPNGTYYDFSNGSDTAPRAVASGTAAGTAVYNQDFPQGPADVDQAGGLSPYGVMGLGGNVFEWEETSEKLGNESGSSRRALRGGNWYISSTYMSSSSRFFFVEPRSDLSGNGGFRVATLSPSSPPVVPEPSMMLIGALSGLGGLVAKRQMKK
jgi:hypothetical protein